MWMGPKAFRFYVLAAVGYLMSDSSTGNADAANAFCGLLEFRVQYDLHAAVAPSFTFSTRPCDSCSITSGSSSDSDVCGNLYADLRPRYERLLTQLAHLTSPQESPMA